MRLLGNVTLTSLLDSGCTPASVGRLWDGIVVEGDPKAAQDTLGFVEMNGGGRPTVIIENARYGVLAGRPAYQDTRMGLPAPADGGGLIRATNAQFHNCNVDVWLAPYEDTTTVIGNASVFNRCRFWQDAPLPGDSITNLRYYAVDDGRSYVRLIGTGATFRGCTFEFTDTTAAFQGHPIPAWRWPTGLLATDAQPRIESHTDSVNHTTQVSRFRHLRVGVWAANAKLAYPVLVTDARFEGNDGGIYLSGVIQPVIEANRFRVGGYQTEQPYGLALYNCTGLSRVTANAFTMAANATGRASGIVVTLSDGYGAIRRNTLYQNYFDSLMVGILAQRGNQGLTLKCNSFVGMYPDSAVITSSITYADILVDVGNSSQTDWLEHEQGECNSSFPVTSPAGNAFSHSCHAAKDIWLYGPNVSDSLIYHHHRDAMFVPGGSGNCIDTLVQADNCGINSTYRDACPPAVLRQQSAESLTDSLATLTAPAARAWVLDELLGRYLTSVAYATSGLDSAIALLSRVQEPGFDDEQAALTDRRYGSGQSRAARTRGGTLGKRARPAVAATATRGAGTGSYFDQVRELLAPLGSDSAITATLRADSTLRQQLLAIAHDTTTWGYVAGQAALMRYLGYRFKPWYENRLPAGAGLRHNPLGMSAAVQPIHLPAFARAYPNPTTGVVRIDYHLPDAQPSGQFCLFDALGHRLRAVELTEHTGTVELDVAPLPAGLYFYALQARGQLVAKGKLLKQP